MTEQQRFISAEIAPRLAAIDLGSNSVRLVVAEAMPNGRYRVLDEERVSTRLGRTLSSTGELDQQSIDDTMDALRRFQSIIEGRRVDHVRAIATCAVREATNGAEFCDDVREQLGLDVEVITANKEAHLAFLSVRRRFDLAGKNTILADIGGGSTELVLASGELIEAIYGTQLGAVRLSERFGGGQALAGDDYEKMSKWIGRELRRVTEKPAAPLHLLIGSGGTFTNLGSMIQAARKQGNLPVAGCRVSRAELRHLIDRLRKMSPKQRREVPGINPDRADIIVPGLAVIDRVMQRFRVNVLQVHAHGVRDGLLLSMIDKLQGGGRTARPDQQAEIERFAEACGVERTHGKHVALLARQIFEGVCKMFDLRCEDADLLAAAAQLQDVGYLINYEGHHKHSYHLILHSRLTGFTPEELEIIANVARYHRGADPKRKHANFSSLSRDDQARVEAMAAVLRLAGGLERTHNQAVTGVRVRGDRKHVELVVNCEYHPEVNIWATRRRAGLFEKVFGAEITVTWAGAAEADSQNGLKQASTAEVSEGLPQEAG